MQEYDNSIRPNGDQVPEWGSVERYKTFTAALDFSHQAPPVVLRENAEIAAKIDKVWSSVARNFDQSFWQPEFGEAVLKSTFRLSERIERGSISDAELAFIERFTEPIAGVHSGNLTKAAMSALGLMVRCPEEPRRRVFELLDSLVSERNPYTVGFAGVLADSFFSAYLIQGGEKGAFRLIEEAGKAYHRIGAREETEEIVPILDGLASIPVNDFMVEGFIRNTESVSEITQVREALGHVAAYALAKQTLVRPSIETNYLFRISCGLPLGLWNRGSPTLIGRQIKANFLRLSDAFEGFHADTYMARRVPGVGGRSLYDRFGSDIGTVRILNHGDRNGFPGPGLLLKNIDLERALKPHYKKNARDPLEVYRDIWPRTETVLHHLPETQFMISRAEIAVISPKGQLYQIQPVPGKLAIPYSLVMANVNHGNEKNHIATLVPTEVLEKKLEGCSVQISPEFDLPDPLNDVNEVGFRIEDLRKDAHDLGYPLISVGSPAALSGHYEYTIDIDFAPSPMPLDQVADIPQHQRRVSRAGANHVFGHAMRIDTIYGHEGPDAPPDMVLHHMYRPELHASMLHRDISMVTDRLIQLWQGVKYVRSTWSKGHTAGVAVETDFTHEELHEALQSEGLPAHWNANCVRMLTEAYKWHRASQQDPERHVNEFPVLVAASAQWHASAPAINDLLIDTYSGSNSAGLLFRDIDGNVCSIDSPTDGKSLDDAVFFVREVLQHVTGDHIELRFYDRRVADWDREVFERSTL